MVTTRATTPPRRSRHRRGPKARHRLNPRGNRHPNWAIHTIAVTQLRYDTAGRRFYDRKVAEGKTTKEAQRALKRRISDVVYRHLVADAHRREQQPWGQARILTTADGFWTHAGTGKPEQSETASRSA